MLAYRLPPKRSDSLDGSAILYAQGTFPGPTMTYGESLRAAWLLLWRGLMLAFLTGVVGGLVIGIPAGLLGASQIATLAVSYCVGLTLGIFLIYPWIIRMMMRKRFKGFRLEIVRSQPDNTVP